MRRERDNRPWYIVGIALACIGLGAGYAIVNRLSTDALAVLVGAICGIGASIPTTAIIVLYTRRERAQNRPPVYPPNPAYPPIIVQPPTWPGLVPGPPYNPTRGTTISHEPQREFVVVGDEE